jgi:hypothetical protein
MSIGGRRAVGCGCLLVVGLVLVLVLIGHHDQSTAPASLSSSAPTIQPAARSDALRVVYARDAKVAVHKLAVEGSEVLRKEPRKEALRVLKQQGDWLLLVRGGWVKAAETAPSSPEAEKQAKKQEAEQARTEAITLAEGRRKIAAALRQRWLDQGVNIKVRVSGTQADKIVLTYPLFDEVWANTFNKPDNLFWMLRTAGFTRVDLDNGSNFHMYWNLAK